MSVLTRRRRTPKHAGPGLPPPEEEMSVTDAIAALDDEPGAPGDFPHPDPAGRESAREQIDRLLAGPEVPTLNEMQRALDGLRAWDPAASPVEPVRILLPVPVPVSEPEPGPDAAPGAAALLALGGDARNAVARLDGMPERRTVHGRPVLHLGDDPERPGEAFAVDRMSDAWLDALIVAATEERGARRAAQPSFTPRPGSGTGPAAAAGVTA